VAAQLPHVETAEAWHARVRIRCSGSGQEGDDLEGLFELAGEECRLLSVLAPPSQFAVNVADRGCGEPNAAGGSSRPQPFENVGGVHEPAGLDVCLRVRKGRV